jgi:phosphoglycerate dehydrogenase-like enzyme
MAADRELLTVAVVTPLEPELAERIAAVDQRVRLRFEPALLPPPRYPSDHRGAEGFRRLPEAEHAWRELLEEAEVLFGVPGDSAEGLRAAFALPRVRWIQGTSAGAGELAREAGIAPEELERVALTTASGVHAGPLAEWCLFALLAFAKDVRRLERDRRARRWEPYAVGELRGRTLVVVGVGEIGTEVARLARAFGMRVVGMKRDPSTGADHVDELVAVDRLGEALGHADAVVVTLPLTDATRGLVGEAELAALPPHAVFVNVGRGGVVDEAALVDALRDGRLAGAALDVTAQEPPPSDSPLWTLDRVLLSPHTAALVEAENARIVELFCANLGRYLAGEPLRNRVGADFY